MLLFYYHRPVEQDKDTKNKRLGKTKNHKNFKGRSLIAKSMSKQRKRRNIQYKLSSSRLAAYGVST